jgi:hypothetical protein
MYLNTPLVYGREHRIDYTTATSFSLMYCGYHHSHRTVFDFGSRYNHTPSMGTLWNISNIGDYNLELFHRVLHGDNRPYCPADRQYWRLVILLTFILTVLNKATSDHLDLTRLRNPLRWHG